jgi:asparagine synthase (glutamine-hydrolysing)
MCGINGIVRLERDAPPLDVEEASRTREAMASRGPDGAGLWISPARDAVLGHRRLAIIDLSEAAAQPMVSSDGRYVITFNGEIYNYRELRSELQREGAVFRTSSDTEVLLALYARLGARMLSRLRGMFAFAVWDEREKRLFLARDAFGIKPLYYARHEGTLRFASQVKALEAGRGSGAADPAPGRSSASRRALDGGGGRVGGKAQSLRAPGGAGSGR